MMTWPFPSSDRGAAAAAPAPMRPGAGVRLTANDLGTALARPRGGQSWPHPWRATLGGRLVRFRRGTVDGIEPMIGALKMSAGALQLTGKVNARGESFVCVELDLAGDGKTPPDGRVTDKTPIYMVETKAWRSFDPLLARQPIAVVLWRQGVPFELHQVTRLDMIYERVIGGGGVVHLFR